MDGAQFEELTLKNERLLYRVAYTLLRDEADCADAVQEGILRAWKHRFSLRDEGAFRSWMVKIVSNACKEQMRKRRDVPVEEIDLGAAIGGESALNVTDALSRLPEETRLPLVLNTLEGMTTREIARALKTPEGTIKSRISRGRESLRRMLGEEDAHERQND